MIYSIKNTFLSIFTFVLASCTFTTGKLNVSLYESTHNEKFIRVQDGRSNPQLSITGMGIAGANMYIYDVSPSLSESLLGSIQYSLGNIVLTEKSMITIEDVEVQNELGFATRDKIYCKMLSSVSIAPSISTQIETLSENFESLALADTTFGKRIVDQCIAEHGRDIAAFIGQYR